MPGEKSGIFIFLRQKCAIVRCDFKKGLIGLRIEVTLTGAEARGFRGVESTNARS